MTTTEHNQILTVNQFIEQNKQEDNVQGDWELENSKLLEIKMDGSKEILTQTGSMVAYRGNIEFEKRSAFADGIGSFFKKAISGQDVPLTIAKGSGRLYLADQGKYIHVIRLTNADNLSIKSNDLLAFDTTITHETSSPKGLGSKFTSGLFNIKLSGEGHVAFTTHGEPLVLAVTPDNPVVTDPNATVAWSSSLDIKVVNSISLKNIFRGGSGETFSNRYTGNGFVVVQPYEEIVGIIN